MRVTTSSTVPLSRTAKARKPDAQLTHTRGDKSSDRQGGVGRQTLVIRLVLSSLCLVMSSATSL